MKEQGIITQEQFLEYRNAYLAEARGGPKAPPLPGAAGAAPTPTHQMKLRSAFVRRFVRICAHEVPQCGSACGLFTVAPVQ